MLYFSFGRYLKSDDLLRLVSFVVQSRSRKFKYHISLDLRNILMHHDCMLCTPKITKQCEDFATQIILLSLFV
jgi:hypothetical protein